MNKYKLTTFAYGQSTAYIIEAFDMVSALQSGQVNQLEVVKIEFVGSTNIQDFTTPE